MDIQLNIVPSGATAPVITCYVIDKNWKECPFEPRIKQQNNFFASDVDFETALGKGPDGLPLHPGPFQVYASVIDANGYGYVPLTPWDGKATLDISVTLVRFNSSSRVSAPRFWKGNMCGVRIPGLNYTPEGSFDNTLVMSWFYDRYDIFSQAKIRQDWRNKDLTHHNLSWPDSKAFGQTEDQFIDTCLELIDDQFFPCPFLFSKDFDSGKGVDQLLAETVTIRQKLHRIGIPLLTIAWEANLFLTSDQHQQLIDGITPDFVQIGTKCYCHLGEGYPSYQREGEFAEAFWHRNINKLTGILYQKRLSEDNDKFRDSISDCLQRFSGGWGMPDDSGFGHPFDFVCFELSADLQFNSAYTEQRGNELGTFAINSPHCFGPTGAEAMVMGSGNGHI